MPISLRTAEVGDTVLIKSHNIPKAAKIGRFTSTMIIVQIESGHLKLGYYERRFYKKDGREVGDRWTRIELPDAIELEKHKKDLAHLALIEKLNSHPWHKLTFEALQGIERIAECPENLR